MDWMKLIWEARRRIAPYLQPTPLYSYPLLSDLVGAEIHVKHENHQPTGAFKVRGGINLIGSMPEQEKALGVITASTGNHGQSIAYASRLFGVRSVIGVPENCNPSKLAAMKSWGAEIVIHGSDFDETREYVERLAAERGMRYIHPANEPLLIAGVATIALEVLEELPEAEVLICPVGGGSSCAGAPLGESEAVRSGGRGRNAPGHSPVPGQSARSGRGSGCGPSGRRDQMRAGDPRQESRSVHERRERFQGPSCPGAYGSPSLVKVAIGPH